MTKRKLDSHHACLVEFSAEFRRMVAKDLKFWRVQNLADAEVRRLAYGSVAILLREIAEMHDIPAVDLGLADYEPPSLDN